MARKRTRLQHEGIATDAQRIMRVTAKHGLMAYCEARAHIFGGDAQVIYDLWTRALLLARTPFADLPDHLRDDNERFFTVRSKDEGCFGYALAWCVGSNVKAVNAIACYPGRTHLSDAMRACKDNDVPFEYIAEPWANRSRERLIRQINSNGHRRAFVVLYQDHAVAVTPTSIVVHGALGRREISWRDIKGSRVDIAEDF
jgi:hypothetical protein